MSQDTPGISNNISSVTDSMSSTISSLSKVRSISDDLTIYKISSPIPSKPTLKPLDFDMELCKGSPTKVSPQKLSPLPSGTQNVKILNSSSLSMLSPKRETHSPSDMPQFINSPSSQSILLIPSKPELTVTLVSTSHTSPGENTIQTSAVQRSPVSSLPINNIVQSQQIASVSPLVRIIPGLPPDRVSLQPEMSIKVDNETPTPTEVERLPGRRKRNRKVLTQHFQKSMYRTRTATKATLAAQNEKESIVVEKTRNVVPSYPASKDVAANILDTSSRSGRKRNQRKFSTAEQLEQIRRGGSIDLETPGSILKLINLKSILTKHNFLKLPADYQSKLLKLLPDEDSYSEPGQKIQPRDDAFDNIFYYKACEDWKTRLLSGDFTPEQKLKQRLEAEKDKLKVDPWKLKNFEPIWGESLDQTNRVKARKTASVETDKSSTATSEAKPITSELSSSTSSATIEENLETQVINEMKQSDHNPLLSQEDEEVTSPLSNVMKRNSSHLENEVESHAKKIKIGCPPSPDITKMSNEGVVNENATFYAQDSDTAITEANDVVEMSEADIRSTELALEEEVKEVKMEDLVTAEEQCVESKVELPDFDQLRNVENPTTENPCQKDLKTKESEVVEDNISCVQDVPSTSTISVDQLDGSNETDYFTPESKDKLIETQDCNLPPSDLQTKDISPTNQSIVSAEDSCVDIEARKDTEASGPETIIATSSISEAETFLEQSSIVSSPVPASTEFPTISIPSPKPEPIPPTTIFPHSAPLAITQPTFVSPEPRPPQPQQHMLLRMVSLPGSTTSGSIQPASIRIAHSQQSSGSAPLSSFILKPVGRGGKSGEIIRNVGPKNMPEFIPTQPRTFIRPPDTVRPQSQPIVSVPKGNGAGTIGGIVPPNSPGNVSCPLNSKKNNRQKPRQAKPKTNINPPGTVNLDRSYQICNQVIQSSPNREQLQKQLVKPPPLTQSNRPENITRPESGGVSDVHNPVIQISNRRATAPAIIQASGGSIPILGGVGSPAKVVMVNQGMAPLLRPIQQQTQGVNNQIIVSSSNNSNGLGQGQKDLGMSVTFTTKHNPLTNNQSVSSTLTSTSTIITPQQITLLFQQQPGSRPNQSIVSTANIQQPRTPFFITRSAVPHQPNSHMKVLSSSNNPSTQLLNQARIPTTQLIQTQSSRQIAPSKQTTIPIRKQMITSNGETFTIHRGGLHPVRSTSTIRPSSLQNVALDPSRSNVSSSVKNSPTSIVKRSTVSENIHQSLNVNSVQTGSPPPPVLSPASNLVEFFTTQLATNIRPISPLAFEPAPDRNQSRVASCSSNTTGETSYNHNPVNVTNLGNPSHQIRPPSQTILANTETQTILLQNSQHGLTEIANEPSMFDLQEALGDNVFNATAEQPPSQLMRVDEVGEIVPPPLQPVAPILPTTNQHFPITHKRAGDGNIVVQNTRVEGQIPPDSCRPQQIYVFQANNGNGVPHILLSASVVMPPSQDVKPDIKIDELTPPRASSAPPSNQPALMFGQQLPQVDLHDNKTVNVMMNMQPDFLGNKVHKDELVRTEDFGAVDFYNQGIPSNFQPTSYTLAPVSCTGPTSNPVLQLIRQPSQQPNPQSQAQDPSWTYTSIAQNGHIVGSARIIPGQHPVISLPDTTNESVSGIGGHASGEFDIFGSMSNTGSITTGENVKIENNGSSRSILSAVPMTNNNRQHYATNGNSVVNIRNGQNVVDGSGQGNCVCDLQALLACRKCGAFSHTDCLKGEADLCMDCIIR